MNNNIKKIRLEKGLTLEDVAERADTTFSQVRKLENGERRLTVDWMQRISIALGCKPQDLLINAQTTIPVIGYVGAFGMVTLFDSTGKKGGKTSIPLEVVNSGEYFQIEVKDPLTIIPGVAIQPGWKISCKKPDSGDPKVLCNEKYLTMVCIVETANGQLMIRRVLPGSIPNRYHLVADGAPFMPDMEVNWFAPIRNIEQSILD